MSDTAHLVGGKLTAPFVWHGGKRRWAEDVWARFGEVEVYSEPFAATAAMLLGSPRMSPREIICDIYGFIPNFWRAVRADPHTVARWADKPTFHHDLYATHIWLLNWGREFGQRLMVDLDFYDAKAAGLWVWGVNLWIGGGWCADVGDGELSMDAIPRFDIATGGVGTAVQRKVVPSPPSPQPTDRIPHVSPTGSGSGTTAQRRGIPSPLPPDKIPALQAQTSAGWGTQVHRRNIPNPLPTDKRPHAGPTGGGSGTAAQRRDIPAPLPTDSIPKVSNRTGGGGVSAQRENPPQPLPPDSSPSVADRRGGRGVEAQRLTVPQPKPIRDSIPILGPVAGYGRGTMPTWANVPLAQDPANCAACGASGICPTCGGGHFFGAQHFGKMPIGEGERLFNWFYALAERLAKVVVLNRDWRSAVTPTVLQHTDTAPKPEVAVFLDPPYTLRSGRSDTLYQSDVDGESDDAAAAAYAWAVAHGDLYRIAYAMHVVDGEPDFPVPEGWEARVKSFSRGRDGAQDLMIFSPRCGQPPKTLSRALGPKGERATQGELI